MAVFVGLTYIIHFFLDWHWVWYLHPLSILISIGGGFLYYKYREENRNSPTQEIKYKYFVSLEKNSGTKEYFDSENEKIIDELYDSISAIMHDKFAANINFFNSEVNHYKNEEQTNTYMDYSKNVNISNSPGAIANVAEYMENVSNHVNQNLNPSTAPDEIKELVKQLMEQIANISPGIDSSKAELMGKDVKALSDEVASPQPRKSWYKLALEGIKETATTIGEVAKPVLEIVTKLMPLLLLG